MKRISIVIVVSVLAISVWAELPRTLTIGGGVSPAADGTSASGAVWVAYDASDVVASGMVEQVAAGVWVEDIGMQVSADSFADVLLALSKEVNEGTLSHTGYYAVMNHVFKGRDPVEFGDVTLRQIPIPTVTADAWAYLNWSNAVEDIGDAGMTNIIGYNVFRSTDGVSFTRITPVTITQSQFTDAIPDDAEYHYAIGLVYQGTPPVTAAVLSAVSSRVFKDSDGDGLPDYFKIANDLQIGSGLPEDGPQGDPDSDRMSNYEEWLAGTRANDSNSYFFVKQSVPSGEGMLIRWDAVDGRRYILYRNSDLREPNWTPIYGPVDVHTTESISYTDPYGDSNRFYRLDVEKP